tara:strand:- start:616 stop:1479 length:864 start_codon:yes stop_codon:yes gene_type:complete
MLIEKIIPVGSDSYSVWRGYSSELGKKIDSQGWAQLFSIWTLTVGGIVLSMDLSDRYIYWEWSGWIEGLLKLFIVSIIFIFILKPNAIWTAGTKRLNIKEFLIHTVIGSILIVFGLIDLEAVIALFEVKIESFYKGLFLFYIALSIIPYVFSLLSCLMVFQFILKLEEDKGTWNNFNWENKFGYLSISVGFMILAMLLGIFLEDPVVSTAAAVSIPFPLIALIWPNHVRHLQRARFYPFFTFAMFLSVRAAWFLVPLVVLFFTLRMVNYFRYGIVHPSFGVDFLEEE